MEVGNYFFLYWFIVPLFFETNVYNEGFAFTYEDNLLLSVLFSDVERLLQTSGKKSDEIIKGSPDFRFDSSIIISEISVGKESVLFLVGNSLLM